MKMVHPAFDPVSRTWFTDSGAEAPTVRELLSVLGPGYRVVGYSVSRDAIGTSRDGSIPPATKKLHRRPLPPQPLPKPTRPGAMLFLKIRIPPPRDLQLPERPKPSAVVLRPPPRQRPVVATKKPQKKWTRELDLRVERLLRDGVGPSAVAREIGVTRNALVGRRDRMKKAAGHERRRSTQAVQGEHADGPLAADRDLVDGPGDAGR